jgi:hypothetical protein
VRPKRSAQKCPQRDRGNLGPGAQILITTARGSAPIRRKADDSSEAPPETPLALGESWMPAPISESRCGADEGDTVPAAAQGGARR